MGVFNGGFPVGYQPAYNPYAAGYQYQQQAAQIQPQAAPSSRMVEVFPVDDERAVDVFPVGNGSTVMLIARDDSFIAVKSVSLDGTPTPTIYDKRPPAPPAPAFDPSAYVTRTELEERLAALSAPTRAVKKEAAKE